MICLQVCVHIYQLTGFIILTCRDGTLSRSGPNLACQLFNFLRTSCYQKLTRLIVNKASTPRPSPQQFLISYIDTLFHSINFNLEKVHQFISMPFFPIRGAKQVPMMNRLNGSQQWNTVGEVRKYIVPVLVQ